MSVTASRPAQPTPFPGRRPPRGAPAVLVLWTGFSAGARAVRALRVAGFRVLGAHPEGAHGGRSAGCPRPARYPSPVRDPDGFMAAVARIVHREGVDAVLPVDEDIVRLLARRGGELAPAAVVGPDASQYDALADKARLAATARDLGVGTPATVVGDRDGASGPLPALPSVVKPRTSRSTEAAPRAVATAGERDARIAELLAAGHAAVVQERIEGPRRVVQSVRGPGTWEYVVFEVRAEWPRGAGVASRLVPDAGSGADDAAAAARALLDHVGYVGPSGVSVIARDGRMFVHDVNLRLGASSAAVRHAGLDMQRRAVEVALGIPGAPFGGDVRTGPYLRVDLEIDALLTALRGGPGGGAPGVVARGIASVAFARDGMLDPSPLDPFWLASRVRAPLLRRLRRLGRAVTPGRG